MAKLLLVFVIGLIALQGATPAAINSLQSRNAFGHVVQELTEELQIIMVNLNGRLTALSNEFSGKFEEILKEANFNDIITNVREEVAKINSEDTGIDFCGETAINEIERLEQYVKTHTFTCKYEVTADVDGLKNKLELLVQGAQQLNAEIVKDVYACMKQSHGNMNKFGECLKEKVETIKNEMEGFNEIVLDILEEVEKSSDFVMNKFADCVSDAKKEVESKAQLIVSTMKACVNGDENTPMLRNALSVSEVIVDVTEKLQHLLTELLQRIAKVTVNFNDKIVEMLNELSFNRVMDELRQVVSDIVADDGSPDECGRIAKDQVQSLDNSINKHVFTCKFENVQEIESLVSKMQVLVQRVRKLLQELVRDVYVCKKESHGDSNKYEKCLKQKVDKIQSEIEEVEKATQETMDQVENVSNVLVDKFEECARKYETEVENKAQQIVTDLKTCMQLTHSFPMPQHRNAESIQDYYKVLADKIHEESLRVTINLPKELSTFSDNVNIIVSNHNIEVLIVKIKEQIKELLSESNKDTSECKLEATPKVDLLVSESQSALEQCVSDVQLVADDLEKQFNVLAEKSAVLADELSNNILVCAKDYPTNILGFAQCLSERAESLKDKVAELQAEVDKTVVLALKTTKEAVQSLNKCMDKVEVETASKGQLIIEDLQKCIRNLDLLF